MAGRGLAPAMVPKKPLPSIPVRKVDERRRTQCRVISEQEAMDRVGGDADPLLKEKILSVQQETYTKRNSFNRRTREMRDSLNFTEKPKVADLTSQVAQQLQQQMAARLAPPPALAAEAGEEEAGDEEDIQPTFCEYYNEENEVIEIDGAKALALWDFVGERESDLSFKRGDSITVIRRYSNGWWEGELNGCIGDFPCNFVELDEEAEEAEPEVPTLLVEDTAQQQQHHQQKQQAPPAQQQAQQQASQRTGPPQHPPPQPHQVHGAAATSPRSGPPAGAVPMVGLGGRSHTVDAGTSGAIAPSAAAVPVSTRSNTLMDAATAGAVRERPLKMGFLTKKGHRRKNWKVRYFILQKGKLSYYSSAQDYESGRKEKGTVQLLHSVIVKIAPEMRKSNCFACEDTTKQRLGGRAW